MELTIIKKTSPLAGLTRFKLALPAETEFEPGQFLHIAVSDGHGAPILRRPISIAEFDGAAGTCDIIFREAGAGTALLAKKRSGEKLDAVGPVGHGFPVEGEKICVIGGGIGIYPLLSLLARHTAGVKAAFLGFRSKADAHLVDEFSRYADTRVATDDGSLGYHGFAPALADENFDDFDTVYACGPRPMLVASYETAKKRGAKCWVSMEERMGCGVGACLGCAVRTKSGMKRVCADGPAFDADEIEWGAK